jgi:Heparinase II/III-like protein/Heparinase II/III N-terminus
MQISWYIIRLTKMSLPEIAWRVWEKVKKLSDKIRNFNTPDIFFMPGKSIFSLSKHSEAKYLNQYFLENTQKHLSIADSALENTFSAFGVNIAFNKDINWHIDPVTKKKWPQKFWGDIDYRDKSFGGVKFVWEINRLYFLFPLAISYRLTKKKKYADEIIQLVKSWIKGNPYPFGVNWASGIEAGVRLANLVWALSFLEEYRFSRDDLITINSFVWFHANHLQRYPSKFSSSNNHLLAEGFGLFIAGLYFPHLKCAEKWLNKGKNILEKQITRQILPDGGSFEYSTTYLSFVVDFFLLFKISCDTNGIAYSRNIDERLEKSCEFIKSIMDKNGNIPNIGDQDSAVLVDFGLSNLNNFSSILNTGAVLYNRKDFATDRPDLKTWILTGIGHLPLQTDEQSKDMAQVQMHRQSGLAVIRDHVEEKEIFFTGNAMPLGMAPLYAHGHLDALSFTLSVDGGQIFIDPGTYLYHGGEKWRTYFRSTAAHNTVRLNKKDYSEQTGDFMFGKPYRIIENSLEKKEDKVVWKAGHDAYLKKNSFADIMREIIWDKKKREFIVIDSIKHSGKIFVELFFHCHPECRVESIDKEVFIKRDNIEIKLFSDISLDCEILHGSYKPVSGWYSPGFNEITKTATIRFYGNMIGDGNIITNISVKL